MLFSKLGGAILTNIHLVQLLPRNAAFIEVDLVRGGYEIDRIPRDRVRFGAGTFWLELRHICHHLRWSKDASSPNDLRT